MTAPVTAPEMAPVTPPSSRATSPGTADPRPSLADLEEQLYGHVRDAIDFDALYLLDQLLWGLLDRRGIADDDGEIAKTLIAEAAQRAVRDPDSYFYVSPPPGITKEEAKAVEFDDACPFCHMEREVAACEANPANVAAERAEQAALQALYADSARAWREKHAEQLAKANAAPPGRVTGGAK